MRPRKTICVLFAVLTTVAFAACSSCSNGGADIDAGTDTGTVDTDTDADTDTDSDTDTDTDSDTDTDTDSDTDSDSDTDTDTDADTDCIPDTGSDPLVPPCCQVVTSSSDMHWEGDRGIDGDRIVWREYNSIAGGHTIMMRQLSTGVNSTLLVQTDVPAHPVIKGDWVFWDQRPLLGDWTQREVYRMHVSLLTPEQLTSDSCSDAKARGGDTYFIHGKACDTSGVDPLYFTDISSFISTEISPDFTSPPGWAGLMYDGSRYVAWGWHDDAAPHNDQIYLFDIQNATVAPAVLYPLAYTQVGGVMVDGKVYASTGVLDGGVTEGFDVWIHDIDAGTFEWMDHSPYDQILLDVDGHIAVYADTEDLCEYIYMNGMKSHMEIKDLQTGATCRISGQSGNVLGNAALSGKYLVFVAGSPTSGTIYQCDMEACGFIDSAGHVIPDDPPDAGMDGGS